LSQVLLLCARLASDGREQLDLVGGNGDSTKLVMDCEKGLHVASYRQSGRDPWLVYLNVDPFYDNIRGDPRFKEIVRRIGLPNIRG